MRQVDNHVGINRVGIDPDNILEVSCAKLVYVIKSVCRTRRQC